MTNAECKMTESFLRYSSRTICGFPRHSSFVIRHWPFPMPPILSVSNLTIQRGDTRILHDLSWTVQRREHWVILGANGSGKTSLLSSLTGYLSPTSGSISVLGQTFGESDWRELRLHVGIVSSSVRQRLPDHEPALVTGISG